MSKKKLLKKLYEKLKIKPININEIKDIITIFFTKYKFNDVVSMYCDSYPYCTCVSYYTIIDIIFHSPHDWNRSSCRKDLDMIELLLIFCFENEFIIKDSLQFQEELINTFSKHFLPNGILSDNDKRLYEYYITKLFTPQTIKTKKLKYYTGNNELIENSSKTTFVSLLFSRYSNVGKKFIKKILKYFDSIKINYNDPDNTCLMSNAYAADNNELFSLNELYKRGVIFANSNDLHDSVKYEFIINICGTRYHSYNFDQINENPDIIYESNPIKYSVVNKEIDNDDDDVESSYSVHSYNGSDVDTNIEDKYNYDYLKQIKYDMDREIFALEYNINIIFSSLIDKNIKKDHIKTIFKNIVGEGDEYLFDKFEEYVLRDYSEYLLSEKYFLNQCKVLEKIIDYGFIPDETLKKIYKNGSKVVEIKYPEIHKKILTLLNIA